MKRKSVVGVFLILAIVALSSLHAETLAIYLVTNSSSKLDDNLLQPTGVISDHDFVSYDRKSHDFQITEEAAKRTYEQIRHHLNMPFILVANGVRIYKGDFANRLSSYREVTAPTIMYHDYSIQTNFSIEQAWELSNTPPTDVRNDPRIFAAILKLGLPSKLP